MIYHNLRKTGQQTGKMTVRKTFLFMDTISNKVDAKGRVSLPSDYRAIVKELSTEIVCYRSLSSPCIEGCTEELLEKLASEMETSLDFSPKPRTTSPTLSSVMPAALRSTAPAVFRFRKTAETCRNHRHRGFCRQRTQVPDMEPGKLGEGRSPHPRRGFKNRPSLRPSGGADE